MGVGKKMKRIFLAALIGLGIGVVVSIIFNILMGSTVYYATNPIFYSKFNNHFTATLICFILYMLIGIISYLGSYIYKTRLSLLLQTLFNLLTIFITIMAIGYYLYWFRFNNYLDIIINIIVFLAIYFIIWSLKYLETKKKIIKINEKIRYERSRKDKN